MCLIISTCQKFYKKKNYFVETFFKKKQCSKNFRKSNSRRQFNTQRNCFISNFTIFFIKIYIFDSSQRHVINLHKFKRQQKIRH